MAIVEDKSVDAGANEFKNWLAYLREMPGFFESYEVLPAVSTLDAVQMVLAKPKK